MKRTDIELIRIIAAFGIVWYHVRAPLENIAYSGLVVFLGLSTFLYKFKGDKSPISTLLSRAQRLIQPWAVWFLLYGILNLVVGNRFLPSYTSNSLTNILAGTSIHLWFLPFIFCATAILDLLHRVFSAKTIAIASAIVAMALLGTSHFWRIASIELGYPFAQYTQAFPALLIGRFLGEAKTLPATFRTTLLALIGASTLVAIPIAGVGIPYALGFGIITLISTKDLSKLVPFDPSPLSGATFGVYLSHIVFTASLLKLIPNQPITVAAVSFLLSLVAILGLQKLLPRIARQIC